MKRIVSLIALGGLMAALLLGVSIFRGHRSGMVANVHAQENDGRCTNATLKGAYAFYRSGTRGSDPVAAIGLGTFDGTGAVVTARQTIVRNGAITSDLFTTPEAAGPYEVEPDCSGKFINPDGSVLAHFVIVDGGKELFFTSLTPGVTSIGVEKKIE